MSVGLALQDCLLSRKRTGWQGGVWGLRCGQGFTAHYSLLFTVSHSELKEEASAMGEI